MSSLHLDPHILDFLKELEAWGGPALWTLSTASAISRCSTRLRGLLLPARLLPRLTRLCARSLRTTCNKRRDEHADSSRIDDHRAVAGTSAR
ncbi:MAG TPA: hypothetical protein VF026_27695 [Ktedonobacteraceae bacterium]